MMDLTNSQYRPDIKTAQKTWNPALLLFCCCIVINFNKLEICLIWKYRNMIFSLFYPRYYNQSDSTEIEESYYLCLLIVLVTGGT